MISFSLSNEIASFLIQVQSGLVTDEEREKICAAVDYSKLSPATCSHLARNSGFPPWSAVRAITAGQSKIKTLLRAAEEREQIVIYARKMEVFPAEDTEKMRAHLRGMQWKVAELEKICRRKERSPISCTWLSVSHSVSLSFVFLFLTLSLSLSLSLLFFLFLSLRDRYYLSLSCEFSLYWFDLLSLSLSLR